ncbi:MAG: carboxylating nicotinate-nucleotide diphosphorylase [Verrucomicrobiota bacterium]
MTELTEQEIDGWVAAALAEDVGGGDVTTLACLPAGSRSRALLRAREACVVGGMALAVAAFRHLDANVRTTLRHADGRSVGPGEVLLEVAGHTRALLTAERVALNFVQRLSGVATLTARYVAAVAGTGARILDTRKTTPGWRRLEKYAVACGGGTNHRMGLHDLVLIKDNHLAALAGAPPNPVAAAVARARALYPRLRVEVEADRLEQVAWAVDAGADIILLDNMSPEALRAAVARVAGRARTEASGGVRLETVRTIAETGVDFISVGALTHSARAVDLGLDFVD